MNLLGIHLQVQSQYVAQSRGQLWVDENSYRISFTQQIKSRFFSSSACKTISLIVCSMRQLLSLWLVSGQQKGACFTAGSKAVFKGIWRILFLSFHAFYQPRGNKQADRILDATHIRDVGIALVG